MQIMIDLETMGTSADAAIVAIGACGFNHEAITDTFYRTISLESAMASGAEIDASTISWWLKQSNDARSEIANADGQFTTVLDEFSKWLADLNFTGVWGNGAAFDNVILAQSYRRIGAARPWPFWQDRCYRTIKSMSSVPMKRTGTHHNALDDAKTQALHLIEILKAEKKGGA